MSGTARQDPEKKMRSVRLLGLAALSVACASTAIEDAAWIEVQSENFTITSDMKQDEAERLAVELELFRAMTGAVIDDSNAEPSVPTRIFLFGSERSYRPFRTSKEAAGYFRGTLRANFVVVLDSAHANTSEILRHEYAHFLLRNASRVGYPAWYDEGFAELLSTAEQMDEHVVIGKAPLRRISNLRSMTWMPIDRVMAYDRSEEWTPEDQARFYAGSWALLHYLTRDAEGLNSLAPRTNEYLARISEGDSIEEAIESAFGMDADALDRQVQQHSQNGSYTQFGVRTDRLDWSSQTTSRALAPAEVAARLGELAWFAGDTDTSDHFFRSALARNPDHARAHAGLGSVYALGQEWALAERHFARAIEIDPSDFLNELDLGKYWFYRARKTQDPDERHALLRRARRHVVRAYKLDASKPEPYAIYGSTFVREGQDASEGIASLEHAHRLLPSSVDIQLILAEAYTALGRDQEARLFLVRVLNGSHDDAFSHHVRTLLERLDSVDSQDSRAHEPDVAAQPEDR